MHEHSPVGVFFNHYLFDPIARSLGLHLDSGHHAVPDHIVMILLVSAGLIAFSFWLRGRLSVETPGRVQHLVEVIVEAVQGLMRDVIGKNSRPYLPLIGALGLYILCGNLLGLVPGFMSPTSNLNVTVACAICSFVYYNYHGIRKHGLFRYLKHFGGPVWWLAWLMFPVEIVSHLARVLSLSMRLFGNIYAEELIIGSLNQYIFPFATSIPVMFLALFASTIQAFIFILLTMVYISGAIEESHEEGHDTAHHEIAAHPHASAAAA
ncbi:MAG: F0F1 ATP synthase subunit A [Acidobacteria bacterium]|nr:F0F1 ATP synthase subunit A [Acidobacteriota bacterium]